MQQLETTLENREQIYKLLGRLYQTEVAPQNLEGLKAIHFPSQTGNAELDANARRLNAFIADLQNEGLDDLAADYARTFLSAGVADEPAAFPIESVYTSREKLIMQGRLRSCRQDFARTRRCSRAKGSVSGSHWH